MSEYYSKALKCNLLHNDDGFRMTLAVLDQNLEPNTEKINKVRYRSCGDDLQVAVCALCESKPLPHEQLIAINLWINGC